jgi:dimethylargininase
MSIADYDRALVRRLPRSYAAAYARKGIQIDMAVADAQHAAYMSALEHAGVKVTSLSGDETFYDCVFIEDTAIVWRDRALITRMTEHREGEQAAVAAALGPTHVLSELSAGALLEGGDVLHMEETTYVGLTGRTNERGVRELAEFLAPFKRRVVPVPVSRALHLKSAATFLGYGTLLVAPGHVETHLFDAQDVITTARGEEGTANCVRVRDTLLVRRGHEATLAKVRAFADQHHIAVVPLDLSEFEKGDGSATCLSVLWGERRSGASDILEFLS